MESKTDILNELASLSPMIAGMSRANVFTVPAGYFNSIGPTVLACLKEEYRILNLPENMESPDIPVGYFDQLADSILNKIKSAETSIEEISHLSPLLYNIQNKNVFEVPVGYFETLNRIIIDRIKEAGIEDELEELSPLLYSIRRKIVFQAPDGYFAGVSDNVLKKVMPQPAKVVSMRKRNSLVKYAVAAMMIGVTALGIYKYINKPRNVVSIENNNSVAALDVSIEKGKNMNDRQFNEALENLNNADIAKYLENNGDITDVAALNNNLLNNNLPSQEDYLLDGATLESYLDEIEKTTVNN